MTGLIRQKSSYKELQYKEATAAKIDGLSTEFSKKEIPLEININHELKFDEHANSMHLLVLHLLRVLAKREVSQRTLLSVNLGTVF